MTGISGVAAITTSEEAARANQRIEVIVRQSARINSDPSATTADYGVLAHLFSEQTALEKEVEAYRVLLSSNHKLAQTVNLDTEIEPPNWVLPNFIAEGIVLIAGGHGVGKTTTLLPLAMAAAGVHEDGYELAPKHWRHCIYITEDVSQAKLIINGITDELGLNRDHLLERVHIVEAQRMDPVSVITVGRHYRETYTRTVTTKAGDVEMLPLVVFDTMAATFQIENENDNSQASNMIALLKQQFRLPCWIVGHVSKGDLTRDAAKAGNPTLRGASAYEADANQVLYLVKSEDDTRWLVRGKSRFESPWQELMIETGFSTCQVLDRFGDSETLIRRWGIARPTEKTRTAMSIEAREKEAEQRNEERKELMIDCVAKQEAQGEPINKAGLYKLVGGNARANLKLVTELIDDGWLAEVVVPRDKRTHHNRGQFLVSLGLGERKEYLESGVLPEHKQTIPECWMKP